MAANSPAAVAISASAMPGATIASVACCALPRPWNAPMIPQTVPKRPTYGLVEPTVASVARLSSRRSISRSCATRIVRRTPSRSSAAGTDWPRRRVNSPKPASKMLSMPTGGLLREPIPRYSLPRSPPDQNVPSNLLASPSACESSLRLRKMIVHETSDASSSIAMTTLTTRPALRISESTECGSFRFNSAPSELRRERLRQRPRLQRVRRDAGRADRRADQELAGRRAAAYFLRESDRRPALRVERCRHHELVVESGGPMVPDVRLDHDELEVFVLPEPRLVDAERSQPLAARALEESQVVRVVHDSAGVGVFPVDAN